ncbi:hypothetical protein TI04_05110 [Achromatium sp. WMS2]|nr:hypothetical protein TI04_05110 [Achromatium sp. WMS2]
MNTANLRILVVGENSTACTNLSEFLHVLGIVNVDIGEYNNAVFDCFNANTADSKPYDFMFLHWPLPTLNGLMLLRSFKDYELQRPKRIVLITHYELDNMFSQLQGLGVTDVLVRPILPQMIWKILAAPPKLLAIPTNAGLDANLRKTGVSGMRVLLIEDKPADRALISKALQQFAVKVDVAIGGSEGVGELAQHSSDYYTLVLISLEVLKSENYRTVKKLREELKYTELPIIMLVAKHAMGVLRRGIDLTINCYLLKPPNNDEVWELLSMYYLSNLVWSVNKNAQKSDNASIKLPVIPGLDLSQGLLNCGDDHELYLALLLSFYNEHNGIIANLSKAFATCNWQEIARLAHTLKGLANMLGMPYVSPLAKDLEHEARLENQGAFDMLPNLLDEVEPILAELDRFYNVAK